MDGTTLLGGRDVHLPLGDDAGLRRHDGPRRLQDGQALTLRTHRSAAKGIRPWLAGTRLIQGGAGRSPRFLRIFVWPGLTTWAILIFFIAAMAVPPLNDLTPLTPGRTRLGYARLAILLLILMSLLHALWSAAGLRCPYL